MPTIYIVAGEINSRWAEDTKEWQNKAYRSLKSAKKHVAKLTKHHKKWLKKSGSTAYTVSKKFRALCPNGPIDQDSYWYWYPLELGD